MLASQKLMGFQPILVSTPGTRPLPRLILHQRRP
jgi:hypothetical protein